MKGRQTLKLHILPTICIIAIALILSIVMILFYEKYFNSSLDGNYNTFCQDQRQAHLIEQGDQNNQTNYYNNTLDYLICRHPMKKRAFLWMQLDGFAFDQLIQIKQELAKDIIILKSVGPSYRQSGAIHESYFTGRVSRNLIGDVIKGDNLAYQIQNTDIQNPVDYLGSLFPLHSLIGSFMEKVTPVSGEMGILSSICEDFVASIFLSLKSTVEGFDFHDAGVHFDKQALLKLLEEEYVKTDNVEEFENDLRTCFTHGNITDQDNSERSTIYYSTKTDGLNHSYSKRHAFNVFQYFLINKLIVKLVHYFQTQLPDAALFISSDHGGQFFNGEDNFCNHGCIHEENHGILLIATPETKNKGVTDTIDYLDVAPTISSFLEDVNLPLFNKGTIYPLQKNVFEYQLLALHTRYIQLCSQIQKIDKNRAKNQGKITQFDLSEKYNSVLINQQTISELQKSDILTNYQQQIRTLQERVNQLEEEWRDYRVLRSLVCMFAVGILCFVYFNWEILKTQAKTISRQQLIIIILCFVLFFSENLLLLFIDIFEDTFYEKSFIFNTICLIFIGIYLYSFDFSNISFLSLQKQQYKRIDQKDEERQQLASTSDSLSSNNDLQPFPAAETFQLSGNLDVNSQRKNAQSSSIFTKIISFPQNFNSFLDSFMTIISYFLLILAIDTISLVFITNDIFVDAKQLFMESKDKIDSLTVFNYLTFFVFYYQPKANKIAAGCLQKSSYFITLVLMFCYDLIDLRYLIRKTSYEVFMCRFLTGVVICSLVFNYARCYLKILTSIDSKTIIHPTNLKEQSPSKPLTHFFEYLHLDFSIFVFFIADEIERFFLITFFFLIIFLSKKLRQILKAAQNPILTPFMIDMLIIIIIFKNMQTIYSVFKGTLSFDFNLQSGNKSVGEYQDQTPICTNILFGIDKMIIYAFGYIEISSMFLRINLNADGSMQFSDSSYNSLACIFMKIMISGLQQCLNFFNDKTFLSLYLWFGSMSAIIVIAFVPYVLMKTITKGRMLCSRVRLQKTGPTH